MPGSVSSDIIQSSYIELQAATRVYQDLPRSPRLSDYRLHMIGLDVRLDFTLESSGDQAELLDLQCAQAP